MLRFNLKANTVSTDPQTRIDYCRALGIESVQEPGPAIAGFAETGRYTDGRLIDHKKLYTDGGIDLAAMASGNVTADMVLGTGDGEKGVQDLIANIQAIGKAGIPVATTGCPVPQPANPADEDALFDKIGAYFTRISKVAEDSGVKLACHSPWPPNRVGWLWGTRYFGRLFEVAPSPANGYLYDNAVHHMLGDDPVAAVHQFKDRIFYVHIRDVKKTDGEGAAGTGYDEVFPGTGDCVLPPVLKALNDINFKGVLCPEHLPPVLGDTKDIAGNAYATAYFRGILAAL